MARTDEERFKVQYMRLKREAEQRDLIKQERARKALIRDIVKTPIRRPRRPIKRRGFFWFGQWGFYPKFKDGGRRLI